MHEIHLEEKILKKNDEIAAGTRVAFKKMGIFSINMVSSPGAGKTSIIEETVKRLGAEAEGIAVIEGDQETDLDKQRIEKCNIPAHQITTGRACHLDAEMICSALEWVMERKGLRLLIIENVGNMVCPAEYDLGEEMMVAVLSVAEGDDKPLKYPALFNAADVLIINKTDLTPQTDFDLERAKKNALKINPGLKIFTTSCRTGEGIDEWCAFLAGLTIKGPAIKGKREHRSSR